MPRSIIEATEANTKALFIVFLSIIYFLVNSFFSRAKSSGCRWESKEHPQDIARRGEGYASSMPTSSRCARSCSDCCLTAHHDVRSYLPALSRQAEPCHEPHQVCKVDTHSPI